MDNLVPRAVEARTGRNRSTSFSRKSINNIENKNFPAALECNYLGKARDVDSALAPATDSLPDWDDETESLQTRVRHRNAISPSASGEGHKNWVDRSDTIKKHLRNNERKP